ESCSSVCAKEMNVQYDSKEKIWSTPKRESMYRSDTSVGRIIFNTMRNFPKNVCQISDTDDVVVTNEQAITWAIRLAQHFKQRGYDHRTVIGIAGRNSTYVLPLGIGCLLNGSPFHAVNPVYDEATLKHMLEVTKPKLVFCDGPEIEKLRAATQGWQPEFMTLSQHIEGVASIETLLQATTTERFYQPEPLRDGANQTVAILCSSGTTGLPKCVCVSNYVLVQDSLLVNSETVFFVTSSLDWLTGLWAFMFSAVFGSTRIITSKPFSAEYFVHLVNKYKINYTTLAPVHLAALIACKDATPAALSSLRNLNYGGGIASQATLQKAQELCKNAVMNSAYAMTEVGPITISYGISNTASAGKPLPGNRIRIVDETGHNLGHNEVGEIYVHTGMPWNGYFDDPVATRQIQDFEGWIHTGDLGYFGDDNELYIVDRKKETLKYQGAHYWPTEIEHAIRELPQVSEVCVVGVPNELLGDAAGALVVRQPDSQLTAKDITDHVARRLPVITKQLHSGVRFVQRLPINANGKTMRKAALAMFVAAPAN
ncbi:hypothetical protein KR222_007530, partial [Zaprionus bogoriensis]